MTISTPTEHTMTATPTKTDALAITPDAAETSALSRWDALASDIAFASEQAEGKEFDYRDKWDNKQARSWVAQLRKLKGKIERARKDAKAVHLERGRSVDEAAKLLEASVQGLIEPHERELKALEAEEQARIDAHKAVLDRIAALAEGVTTADEAHARLVELAAIDASTLEEFAAAGANRQLEAAEMLQSLWDSLRIQEAERAELEKLRAEKAEREEAERIERIRQEAIEAERRNAEAERLAREAEAERQRIQAEEQANKAREAAAAREAQALAAAAAARQAEQEANRREQEARAAADAAQQAEAQRQADEARRRQQAEEARAQRLEAFRDELKAAMKGRTAATVIEAIIGGTLHPAVTVDWSKA
jgi:colicin import membrane protein